MTDDADHTKDGFTFKFRVGNHKFTLRFADATTDVVLGNISVFLSGCGFTRRAIVAGFRRAADNLEALD